MSEGSTPSDHDSGAVRLVHPGERIGAQEGAEAGHGSGDFVISFTTGTHISASGKISISPSDYISETQITRFFQATIEATEEAILNALLKAETTKGREGHILKAIPIDRVVALMKECNRLQP